MLLLFLLGYIIVGLLIMLSVGVAILRTAVGVTNGILGGRTPSERDFELDRNQWGAKLKNPNEFLIETPEFGIAAAAVIIPAMLNFLILSTVMVIFKGFAILKGDSSVLTKSAADMAQSSIMLALLPVCILIRIGLLGGLLRTTFAKAFVVAVMELVVTLVLLFFLIFVLVSVGATPAPSFLRGVL